MTATVYSVTSPDEREAALEAATAALSAGRTVVIPTDTVYGIAADAFSRGGVRQLLAAKGRSRRMPPPVLIADPGVLPGLADDVGEQARALAEAFWPGALTLIVYAQPSLNWDLGETSGTVGLRVPDDELARELLRRTGPLAVSSANRTGRAAATDAGEALEQLGERVEAILDDGPRPVGRAEGVASADVAPSTIVDATGDHLVVVRLGAISMERLREVAPDVVTREELRERRRASAAPTAAETGEDLVAGSSGPSGSTVATGSAGSDGSAGAAAASAGSASGAASARPAVDQMRSRPEGEDGREARRAARRQDEAPTRPLGAASARDLVFGASAAPAAAAAEAAAPATDDTAREAAATVSAAPDGTDAVAPEAAAPDTGANASESQLGPESDRPDSEHPESDRPGSA